MATTTTTAATANPQPSAPATANPSANSTGRHAGPPPNPVIHDKKAGASYRTGRLLGEGGFARCYEVVNTVSGERLAAKIIRKASLTSQKQKHKLFAEIKIHQMMSHPAIVGFTHVFEDDDSVYILLELCENGTMVDMLKQRKRLSEPEVRYYMHHLLHGVNYMHQHRVIHRDLKLGNMFLAKDMRLKIGDFGLAAMIKHDGERKKTICGTPNYIAPEVLFDAQNGHSYEVDLWSLGVVMYTQLVGRPPFQTKEVKQIYKKIKENVYEFPSQIPISQNAKDVINALLNKTPTLRPSVEEVLLADFFTSETVPYSIPVTALSSVPSMSDLNIVVAKHATPSKLHSSSRYSNSPSSESSSNAVNSAKNAIVSAVTKSASSAASHISPSVSSLAVPLVNDEDVARMAALTLTVNAENKNVGVKLAPGAPGPGMQRVLGVSRRVQAQSSPAKTGSSALAVPIIKKEETPLNAAQTESNNSAALLGATTTVSDEKSLKRNGVAPSFSSGFSSPKQAQPRQTSPPVFSAQPRSSLDIMYKNIKTAFAAVEFGGVQLPTEKEVVPHPDVFITKWIDYSNKYGLGYQLHDGSIGVYFNDSTSLLLAADNIHIEYLFYDVSKEPTKMHRRAYTMATYPKDLQKKVTLLKHFGGYMQETLVMGLSSQEGPTPRTSDLIFLTKFLRTKHGVIFRMSNQIIQINLFDHTKLILSQNGNTITYIDKNREMTTARIEEFLASKERAIVDRIQYAEDIILQMILKKQRKVTEGSGGTNEAGAASSQPVGNANDGGNDENNK
ncbi:kinase-like domain-containing protein [Chytriomyces cf. hyalinus JEL632]|nr:kinase-like domain-containing protein [Chytriomyces cf. hyalinus JEL632]